MEDLSAEYLRDVSRWEEVSFTTAETIPIAHPEPGLPKWTREARFWIDKCCIRLSAKQ